MKRILLLLAICCFGGLIWGQNGPSAETKNLINKIKKSQSYLSAEATMTNPEDAMKLANELLVGEINEWVKSKRKSETVQQIVLQDISSCSETMNMKRGTNVRAFVYVKKTDIMLIRGEGQIILSDNEKGNDLQALSEISEPLKIEKDKPASKKDDIVSTVEKIGASSADTNLNTIMKTKTMTDMKKVFADLKEKEEIKYGPYPSDQVSENSYLLFYTRVGDVKAVVEKKGDILQDLNTLQDVKLGDFSGYGAYWFELK